MPTSNGGLLGFLLGVGFVGQVEKNLKRLNRHVTAIYADFLSCTRKKETGGEEERRAEFEFKRRGGMGWARQGAEIHGNERTKRVGFSQRSTGRPDRMSHRKWRKSKQQLI